MPPPLKHQGMGARARPDVEDSGAALAKSFRTVTATSSPRSWKAAKANPSGDQEPLTQKWGWPLGRHTLPVIFQGFLSK